MKLISWNVNGLQGILKRTCQGKKTNNVIDDNVLSTLIKNENPDILCLQEIRCSSDFQCAQHLFGFNYLNCSKKKKGYSGTLICSKTHPLSVNYDFNGFEENEELNSEGRMITLEYPNFYLINVYVPNSKPDFSRLDFRINIWERTLRNYVKTLQLKKNVILVGDLNCVPSDLDIYDFNLNWAGNSPEEKAAFNVLLEETQLVDTFRELNPKKRKYSWSSPALRKQGLGCRLDFCLVSKNLKPLVNKSDILDYNGSDHQPVILDMNLAIEKIKLQKKIIINNSTK